MEDVSEGASLGDADPSYGSSPEQSLINAVLADANSGKKELSEEEVFGRKENDLGGVCPKCGMLLVGKSNYCMGCGMTVTPVSQNGKAEGEAKFDGAYLKGAGYGGGNAYVAREEEIKKRREKKRKKNLLEEDGLARFLLCFLGITVGVVVGVFLLKWYFAPKEQDIRLYREMKSTEYTGIFNIQTITPKDAEDSSGKDKSGQSSRNSGGSLYGKKKKNQYFYGTYDIHAMGDHVEWLEETEVWDIQDIDPNDVTYVINTLNLRYQEYQKYVFMDYEFVLEETRLVVHFAYRNLNLSDNVKTLVRLGVISEEVMDGIMGKEYISYLRIPKVLETEGWTRNMPEAMMTPTPLPVEEGEIDMEMKSAQE